MELLQNKDSEKTIFGVKEVNIWWILYRPQKTNTLLMILIVRLNDELIKIFTYKWIMCHTKYTHK